MKVPKVIVQWLEAHRGLVIVIFCLPASFIFDQIISGIKWIKRSLFSSYATHYERAKTVQRAVKKWNGLPKDKRKFMCTARPNWLSLSTTFLQKSELHKIPVDLYEILELDEEKMVVTVEPLVTVREVTRFLTPRGYTLASTLEIGDATLGGLAMAVGMTTYSHNVGLFQETIVAFEMILGDGSRVHVTRSNEFRDLFKCLPWSHGTLGFVVGLELQIIPAKPYVHVEYIPIHGKEKYCNMMRELSGALNRNAETPDFLEATVFSPESAVISVGRFSDVQTPEQKEKINQVTKWYKPWFYKHVESFLAKGGHEYIPLEEYLLRHNRAIFWVLESMIPFGNKPLFRLLFGWLCPPKPAFLKFTTTPGIRAFTFTKQVFQDIVLPMTALEKSIEVATDLFDTFPLLIYPCRIYDHDVNSGQLSFRSPRRNQMTQGTNYGMFYDLGVYGVPGAVKKYQHYDAVYAMRTMEKFIRDWGGYSFLYADIFMTRQEFEEMFDLSLYKEMREKYRAFEAFPDLYDKVKPEINVFEVGKQNMSN